MSLWDVLKIFAMVPVLLGGAIAVMMLSYLIVPLFIVGIVGLMAFAISKAIKS